MTLTNNLLKAFRIDRTTSYKEANLINKIDRHLLKWKFRINFEFGKLNGTSKTYWTHPGCVIEHNKKEELANCNAQRSKNQ